MPVKPDAAAAARPATPATPADAAAKAAPPAAPKPAAAAKPAAPPVAPKPQAAKPEDVTQPLKPTDFDVTAPMGMKALKLRGIRLTGGALPSHSASATSSSDARWDRTCGSTTGRCRLTRAHYGRRVVGRD